MIVKTVRDREKGQDGKLKNEKNGWLGRAIRFFVYTMSETTRLHRVMWSVYFPCGQDAVGTVELKCR